MDVGISRGTREWLLITAMTTLAWLPWLLFGAALIGSAVLLGHWALAIPPVAVGVFVGMIKDRRDGARLPGRVVRPGEEPELTELVRDVAERLGFRSPLLVRVVPVPQAALGPAKVSGVRAFALVLGLPLLRGLSAAQLAAVVAHELAHEQHVSDRRRARLAASRGPSPTGSTAASARWRRSPRRCCGPPSTGPGSQSSPPTPTRPG